LQKDETAQLKNDQVVYSYAVKNSNVTAVTTVAKTASEGVSIAPNPARDQFSLQLSDSKRQIEEVRILSLDGKTRNLFPMEKEAGRSIFVLPTPANDGLYGIQVLFDDASSTFLKLVVKHGL
jgi:hypothetical protein